MNNKIVCVIIGQDCRQTIDMCIESVSEADAIVFLDGGSTDLTLKYLYDRGFGDEKNSGEENKRIIHNNFDSNNSLMISKQRNFYLEYLKKNYNGWYCLVLDADEVLDSMEPFRKLLNRHEWNSVDVFSPRMRHLINNLFTEDATKPIHLVPHRFFKITDDKFYPDAEHCILSSNSGIKVYEFRLGLIWHIGYLGGVWDVKKRYDGQMIRQSKTSHSEEFLDNWYKLHIFGAYPIKRFNLIELPKVILDNFGIDKDEIYFSNRGLELKHFIDAIHWKEFFKCKTAVEFGCGKGPRVYAMQNIGIDAKGYEISKFAISNRLCKKIWEGNITEDAPISTLPEQDLSIGYDVLEHIEYSKLDKAILNLITTTNKYILISVPVIGDLNLEADSTHIIKENKEWWIKQFTDKGLKLIPTPNHFQFKEQLMIFRKEVKKDE